MHSLLLHAAILCQSSSSSTPLCMAESAVKVALWHTWMTTLSNKLRNSWLCKKSKAAWATCKLYPSTLVMPLLLLAVLLAVGLWGVIWGASKSAEQDKLQARLFASSYMNEYHNKLQEIIKPLSFLSAVIRANPTSWAAVNTSLELMMPDILKESGIDANSSETIFVAPQGRIRGVYGGHPVPVGFDYFDPTQPPRLSAYTALKAHGSCLAGPFPIPAPVQGMPPRLLVIYVVAVMVAAPPQPGWLPNDVPQATNCTGECSEVYKGESFWGLLGAFRMVESYIEPSVYHAAGYSFTMMAPQRIAAPTTDGSSVDVPTLEDGYNLIPIAASATPTSDPVNASLAMDATKVPWALYISPVSGTWNPSWYHPMIAVVVTVSVALAAMQFLALLAWRQHGLLLSSLLPQNVLRELHSQHDFSAASVAELVAHGTPAETMLRVLSCNLQGEPADLRDVVLVRTTLMRGADVYRPVDITAKIKATSGIDSDVAGALARELDASYAASTDNAFAYARSFTHSSSADVASLQDGHFNSTLRSALLAIVSAIAHDDDDISMPDHCQDDHPSIRVVVEHDDQCRSPQLLPTANTATQTRTLAALATPAPVSTADGDIVLASGNGDNEAPQPPDMVAEMLLRRDPSRTLLESRREGSFISKQPQINQLEQQLALSSEWEFDAMELAANSNGHPLSTLGFYVLRTTGLMDTFRLKGAVVARFLLQVEDMYLDNPYHSATHAADVLQTMHVMMQRGAVAGLYADPLGQLACYFATIVHDLGHLGRTNDFLCATSHELAIEYNDRAPLENHHVSQAYQLLKQPGMNFLAALTREQHSTLRRMVIELVLGTDMKQHFSVVSQFKTLHAAAIAAACAPPASEAGRGSVRQRIRQSMPGMRQPSTNGSPPQKQPLPAAAPSSSGLPVLPQLDDAGRLLTLQMVLKCADLGHVSAPLPVHLRWVAALEEEFFRQGDAERANGMVISPLFDRTKTGITKSQVGFFNFAVLPLFHALSAAIPASKPLHSAVESNFRYWQALEQEEKEKQAKSLPQH